MVAWYHRGQTTDLRGHGKISLQQIRRDAEHITDIVKTITDIIGGQQVTAVDLQTQQIADYIRIFGTVQTVQRRAARVGRLLGNRVQFALDMVDQFDIGCLIGPRHTCRRHRPRTQLA